jgi:uncharacterized protein YndB with AHSA1/START domain
MEEFGTVGAAEIVFERRLDAPPERVWRALTDPEELAGWLAPTEIDLRVGGQILISFGDAQERGTIQELREPEVLAYTWNESKTDSLVRFELIPDGRGTHLTLTHTFEGDVDLPSYGGGWHHHLEVLAGQVSGTPITWDSKRYGELKQEYERKVQQQREAELSRRES